MTGSRRGVQKPLHWGLALQRPWQGDGWTDPGGPFHVRRKVLFHVFWVGGLFYILHTLFQEASCKNSRWWEVLEGKGAVSLELSQEARKAYLTPYPWSPCRQKVFLAK